MARRMNRTTVSGRATGRADSGSYVVDLKSRGKTVVVHDWTKARILEQTEKLIAAAGKKSAK